MFRVCDESNLEQINYFLSLFNQPMLVDLNSNPFTKYILYLEEDNYIGFIQYSIIYDRAELDYIYVDDKFRSSGVGSKLMNYMIEDVKNNNCLNISLEVENSNINAINLYKKYNFKEVAVRKNYYQGKDGILMIREVI